MAKKIKADKKVKKVVTSKKVKKGDPNLQALKLYSKTLDINPKSILAVFTRTGYDIVVLDAADQVSYMKLTQDFSVVGTSRFVDEVQSGDAGDEYVLVIKK